MKILSKLISALVSAALVITGVTVDMPFTGADITVNADAFSGVCGDGVEWSFDSATGELNITGTGKMRSFALYSMEKELPWYSLRGEIEAVKIHEGVTRVGDYAFYDCPNVTNIELPVGLESIGTSAFENCKRLCYMAFPITITEVGGNAFSGTMLLEGMQNTYGLVTLDYVLIDGKSHMEEATVPEFVVCIAAEAFSKNKDITFIFVPDNVTNIGIKAFSYCKKLENVRLSERITVIGTELFSNCASLESINIPDSVSVIGSKAFYASGLKSVTLSKNVGTVSDMAFAQCPDLDSITFYNKDCVIYDSKYTISNSGSFTGIIYGYVDSTAQAYADKYGYKFIPIGEDTPEVTEPAVTTTVTSTAMVNTTSRTTVSTTKTTSEKTTAETALTTAATTTVSPVTTKATTPMGDANGDGKMDVRDAAFIARSLASKKVSGFPHSADFNGDGKVNVRDAAAIAAYLAKSNGNLFYPYMLLDMKGFEITGKYGPSEIIEYPAEGGDLWCIHPSRLPGCYAVMDQVTNNPYSSSYSPSFRNDQKPLFISVCKGNANELLWVGMTYSKLIEMIDDQPLCFSMLDDHYYMNYKDGGYNYRINFSFEKGKKFIYPDGSANMDDLSKSLKNKLMNGGLFVDNIWVSKQ